MFATMKNVQEGVLRGIAGKRKFMRNYVVQKNLANNPRTPLDVSLPIMKGLMINDLRVDVEEQEHQRHFAQDGGQALQAAVGKEARVDSTNLAPQIHHLNIMPTDPIADLLQTSKTIAVVGLSDNPMKPSYGVSQYMQSQRLQNHSGESAG